MAAGGHYQMAPDQVARFRTAVDDDRRGRDLEARLAPLETAGLAVAGDRLKTRPRGVDPEHPRLDLLRCTVALRVAAVAIRTTSCTSPRALDRVVATWRTLRPLTEWLADHVGPSEQPRR